MTTKISIQDRSESREADQEADEELFAYLGWLAEGGSEEGGPLGQMQAIFELDADCNVILQGRIGQGFYGEVYRGTLERDNENAEPQQVAVKKLKTRALEADLRDFEREISIMKVDTNSNFIQKRGKSHFIYCFFFAESKASERC